MLDNKVILITGGTGSFGKKFTQMVLDKYNPKKLIIFSRDEMKQYEMSKVFNAECIRYFIGDVRDRSRLHRAFNGVDVVIHAAALKIVPSAEYNPFEIIKTNVIGAENIINVALDRKIKKVIALSTDKAADPVNLYGATKLCSEKMFIAANNYVDARVTKFSVVRYGNVFGSRGSVIPFFKECSKDGVIPITHPEMTRFWITLTQGVNFVLSCLKDMKGGEVFVPKIPSMKIVDLAKAIAPDCKMKVIGIRPGEKLHETLLSPHDGLTSYEQKDRYVICSPVAFGNVVDFGKVKPVKGRNVGLDFEGYRSDNNTLWFSIDQLRKMLKKEKLI
ncbi:MAG: UDP-N-acetylglucosamine 4,6-dehydratase (inverting) [Candidatus Omnitrophica bacterium]|nr:UDP-N-acetylglucosamine 4,6-dehydratase (inverting) [Candidatus Omnitrophota bacterium]